MVDEENNLIFIGVVGNAKGLKGNVKINYFSRDLEKFKSYEYFYLGEKKEKHKVQKHFISGESFSLKFFDINSREEAEVLKNRDVFIDSNQLNKLDLSLIHISEPTRLGMISYAVFCLKKKKNQSLKKRP